MHRRPKVRSNLIREVLKPGGVNLLVAYKAHLKMLPIWLVDLVAANLGLDAKYNDKKTTMY